MVNVLLKGVHLVNDALCLCYHSLFVRSRRERSSQSLQFTQLFIISIQAFKRANDTSGASLDFKKSKASSESAAPLKLELNVIL